MFVLVDVLLFVVVFVIIFVPVLVLASISDRVRYQYDIVFVSVLD